MKLYTFTMPFSGRQTVWLEAESEEQARAMVLNGDWDNSEEQTFNSDNYDAELIEVEDLPEEIPL
jgi:hypothetical protein